MRVFLVEHVRSDDDEDVDVKTIGIFSSKYEAEQAISSLKSVVGFRSYPEGFTISGMVVDRIYWAEGFISAQDAVNEGK
jgi:homoserine kinase type II